jgi:hypothetical protein
VDGPRRVPDRKSRNLRGAATPILGGPHDEHRVHGEGSDSQLVSYAASWRLSNAKRYAKEKPVVVLRSSAHACGIQKRALDSRNPGEPVKSWPI